MQVARSQGHENTVNKVPEIGNFKNPLKGISKTCFNAMLEQLHSGNEKFF